MLREERHVVPEDVGDVGRVRDQDDLAVDRGLRQGGVVEQARERAAVVDCLGEVGGIAVRVPLRHAGAGPLEVDVRGVRPASRFGRPIVW